MSIEIDKKFGLEAPFQSEGIIAGYFEEAFENMKKDMRAMFRNNQFWNVQKQRWCISARKKRMPKRNRWS